MSFFGLFLQEESFPVPLTGIEPFPYPRSLCTPSHNMGEGKCRIIIGPHRLPAFVVPKQELVVADVARSLAIMTNLAHRQKNHSYCPFIASWLILPLY